MPAYRVRYKVKYTVTVPGTGASIKTKTRETSGKFNTPYLKDESAAYGHAINSLRAQFGDGCNILNIDVEER